MNIDKELVAARFARAADTYDDEAGVQRRVARRLAALVRKHAVRPIRDILEVGCGTGCLSRQLLSAFRPRRLLLNDICPTMGDRLRDLGGRVDFVPGDAEERRFGTGFDLVASASVLQWFTDPKAFFARCSDMLNDGGCLAFGTYGPENMRQVARLTGMGLKYKSMGEWKSFLDDSWRIVAVREETVDMPFASPMDVLHHLRRTGVTGIGRYRWSARTLRRFQEEYSRLYSQNGGVTLTYHPLYAVAVKQAKQRGGTASKGGQDSCRLAKEPVHSKPVVVTKENVASSR